MYAAQAHPNPNAGHGYYMHSLMQQAYQQNQLSAIGQALGPGPNPFAGRDPGSSSSSAFQEYSVKDGVLYLGDKPY